MENFLFCWVTVEKGQGLQSVNLMMIDLLVGNYLTLDLLFQKVNVEEISSQFWYFLPIKFLTGCSC